MIPSLNYAVLTNALQALNEGNIRHCEDLGFTFDEMNALSQLSPDALFTLSRAAAPLSQSRYATMFCTSCWPILVRKNSADN